MQSEATSAGLMHQIHVIDFEENPSLRQLTGVFAGARISVQELYLPIESHGGIYVYPFGAMVTCDVPPERDGLQKRPGEKSHASPTLLKLLVIRVFRRCRPDAGRAWTVIAGSSSSVRQEAERSPRLGTRQGRTQGWPLKLHR